jgi:hypothetical protein
MEPEDSEGNEWVPAFTDYNFLTYAPDDAPREDMEAALAVFLNITRERQQEVLHTLKAYVHQVTGLTLEQCATHRWMRLAMAQLRKSTVVELVLRSPLLGRGGGGGLFAFVHESSTSPQGAYAQGVGGDNRAAGKGHGNGRASKPRQSGQSRS